MSINFIIQNLKAQLIGITRIKNFLLKNVAFQWSDLEDLWVIPNKPLDNSDNAVSYDQIGIEIKKKLIFCNDEVLKRESLSLFKMILEPFYFESYK